MSYYLINLEIESDIENFNLDNIIIDNKIEIDSDNYKYLLYYLDNDIPKEIYIKLPKIRLVNDWINLKYNQLKIRITPKYEKTDRIIKMITSLEDKIKIHKFFNKKKKLEFVSLLVKETAYHIKTFFQDNKTKISSDISGKNIKMIDFKTNGEIQMVIKLNNIWQKNEKYGLSSQLYQIKYFASPNEQNINFIDDEELINKKSDQISILPSQTFNPLLQASYNNIQASYNNTQPSRPILMINSQLLQSVKLKSIQKN